MENKRIKRKFKGNNSNFKLVSSNVLEILKKIFTEGGVVTYVFVTDRIVFNKQYPNGIIIKKKSQLKTSISNEIFFKEVKGKLERRTPGEIVEVFEFTQHDLGATYYRIS